MSINDLIEKFAAYLQVERGFSPRTISAYTHDLNKFADFLLGRGVKNIKAVSKDFIRQFLFQLAKTGFSKPNVEVTRARKLSAIKSFFKYLTNEGVVKINCAVSIETPKIPEKEPCYLTHDEYLSLLHTVKVFATPYYQFRDLAIITLFLATGIRLSELVGLSINDIDLQAKTIKVKGKGNKERQIPLNDQVVVVLEKYLETRPDTSDSHLFISRKSNGLSSGSVYHLIKGYLAKSGIKKEKAGVHTLRHSFAVSLLNEDVNLVVIQTLLGHKKLETTRRYLHINSIDLRNAVDQINLSK